MNDLLQVELSVFLGYEPYGKVGYNSGNSRKSMENTDNLLTFLSFPTRFGTALIRQSLLKLSTKK